MWEEVDYMQAAIAVTLWPCIREVLGSNLGLATAHPE
jgi:hypothetical protein